MKKNVFLSVAAASAIAAIATSLALPAFSEPIPEDSASMFRRQQGKAPLPPTSGTTGFYTPPKQDLDPPSTSYIPWTLSFQGQEKCLFVAWEGSWNDISLCARITADGSGNAELYQPAGRMGNDMHESGWFEATYPQHARQWPNWPVPLVTQSAALRTITFYEWMDTYVAIEPVLGPSGLASDWRFRYHGRNCVQPGANAWWPSCTAQ